MFQEHFTSLNVTINKKLIIDIGGEQHSCNNNNNIMVAFHIRSPLGCLYGQLLYLKNDNYNKILFFFQNCRYFVFICKFEHAENNETV